MQFSDIFNEVVNYRFNSGNVASAKFWVNTRYGMVYNDRVWTYRIANDAISVTANSSAVSSMPADFGRAISLSRSDGAPLEYLSPMAYNNNFYTATPTTGVPSYYTVVDGVIRVGPTSSTTDAVYNLLYQKGWVKLVNDTDVPDIPEEYHYMLVHGALATGLALVNDFTFEFQREAFQELLVSMRDNYTSDYGGTLQYERDVSGMEVTGY